MQRRSFLRSLSAAAFAGAVAAPSWARTAPADLPDVIKVIIPYPPGGNADNMGRLLLNALGERTGIHFVVENKAGAGALIGARQAAQSAADGKTLLFTPSAVLTLTPHFAQAGFDPLNQFQPISRVSSAYSLLSVSKKSGITSFEQLVAEGKRRRLTFGSAGVATSTHITGEVFGRDLGLQLQHIPYKGSSQALIDLIAGEIDVLFDPVAVQAAAEGKVTPIVTLGDVRNPVLPQVPASKEVGYQLKTSNWFGLFAPAGVPAELVHHLDAAVSDILQDGALHDGMTRIGQYRNYANAEALRNAVRDEHAYYSTLKQQINVEI